jgi:hypothetical protein
VSIVDQLRGVRVRLDDIQEGDVKSRRNVGDLRGELAELLVSYKLQRMGVALVTRQPINSQYSVQIDGHRVSIFDQTQREVCECDFLFEHEGRPVNIEVVARKLHGLEASLSRRKEIIHSLYGVDPLLIACMPLRDRPGDIRRLESQGVYCVDLGYKQKELTARVQQLQH